MARRRSTISEQRTIYYHPVFGSEPPTVHIPAPGRAPRRRWPVLLLVLLILLGCSSSALAGGLYVYHRNRILPGVQTLGVRLGGQRVEEATQELERNWQSRQIAVDVGDGQFYTMRPSSLGIILDTRATALIAYRQGRNIPSIEKAIRAAFRGTVFEPTWYFDPAEAEKGLQTIAERVYIPAKDAGIEFSDGRARAVPGTLGRELDVQETMIWLQQNAAEIVLSERMPVIIRFVEPEISVADVQGVVDEINQRVEQPITIRGFDPVQGEYLNTSIPAEVWAQWLTLEVNPTASSSISWKVDGNSVTDYLQSQSATLGSTRYFALDRASEALTNAIKNGQYEVGLRIYHRPQQHTVTSGETLSSIAYEYGIPYPWIQHANPGSGNNLYVGQTITIPSPDELLPLPVVENKRIVVSLREQRMWAYENGELKWDWSISTGIESSPTAPGVFQIQTHEPNAYASIWNLWMPKFMGIYRPVPTSDFMNGFHGFPTRNGSNLLWTNSIGRPVTYGCILVSNDNIALLYDWAEAGVVVDVKP